jgi:thiol-disulfide isomerase/thioredoxin
MIAVVALTGLLAFTGAVLILANRAPDVPPISADEIASTKPYVVKLHARWCPICMVTKDAWASVQEAYVGEVRFVVFDFTNAATTEASRAQAARLGLGVLFEQYSGETGSVLVLDGKSREVLHDLHGHRDQVEYRAAIGATLAGMAQHK